MLVVVETLRADRIGLYGHPADTMPRLGALAAEGVTFERAIAAAPWTLPSVASLLTGDPPGVVGVTAMNRALPAEPETVAESLSARGYETAFFGVNAIFEGGRGLDQGYGTWRSWVGLSGGQLHKEVEAFLLERRPDRPLFLHIHLFDPHCPYQPPPQVRGALPPSRDDREITLAQYESMGDCYRLRDEGGAPRLDLRGYADAYEAEVRFADEILWRLAGRLDALGMLENALVVVTGDHGEEFWEHGGFGHERALFEESARVPLVVRPPGGTRAARVAAPVSLVQVKPTIEAVATGRSVEGDLSGWWTGRPPDPRPVFAETDAQGAWRAVWWGTRKVVRTPVGELGFDLALDPAEARPTGGDDDLRAVLDEHVEDVGRRALVPRPWEEDAATGERLRALGYAP